MTFSPIVLGYCIIPMPVLPVTLQRVFHSKGGATNVAAKSKRGRELSNQSTFLKPLLSALADFFRDLASVGM